MGLLDGVVATRPGWLAKREVVEVTFDSSVIAYEALVRLAVAKACAAPLFTRSDAQQEAASAILGVRAIRNDDPVRTDDDKFRVSKTPLRHVPMTPLQASRVNAWLAAQEDPRPLLSPSQLAILERVAAKPEAGWPDVIGVPFLEAWAKVRAHEAEAEDGSDGKE